MGEDPKLDEARIERALTNPDILLTPNGVRSLMSLVLMACYDRRVQREFFGEMLDHVAEVGIIIANMESAAKLRSALELMKPGTATEEIDKVLSGLVTQWNAKRRLVADKFSLVRQCPTSEDTIS